MNNKSIIIIVALFVVGLLALQQYIIWNNPPKEDNILLEKINKLELKLDSINLRKDSIRKVVDSTHVKIVTNEKYYQERINTIITQPDSFSESFTRQYIREYAANNGYYIR